MQTAQAIAEFTSCNNPKVSGYQLTTLLIRNGKKLGLKSSELLVFMALASYWNGKPVFPKINTLSDDTTLSEKAVRTALNGLLSKGYIIKSKRGKNANVYNLNVSMVISTVEIGKSNQSSAVNSTAPCNMKLNHKKLEQRHGVVVSFKDSKGVEGTATKEASSTTVSAVSETQEDKYPLCLLKKVDKGEIHNIKKYWGSLRPQIREEYWEQDRKEAEAKARKERLQAEEEAKKAEERRLHELEMSKPLHERFSRGNTIRMLYNLRRFHNGNPKGHWAELVEYYNIDINEVYAMKPEEVEAINV